MIDLNDVKDVWTLKSMYDQDSVAVRLSDGTEFRIKADELKELFYVASACDWYAKPVKAKVHTYLKLVHRGQ